MSRPGQPGGNCIKIGLPGKLILGDYFQENGTSQRPFLLLRISFPGDLFLYNWSLVGLGHVLERRHEQLFARQLLPSVVALLLAVPEGKRGTKL